MTTSPFDQHLRDLVREVVREELRALREEERPAEYLSVRQAAAEMGVAEGTIRRWLGEGSLPGYNVGACVRVRRDELLTRRRPRRPRPERELTPEELAAAEFGG